MRLKMFSLAWILCCVGSLIRDAFRGKLENEVKKKSRANYLKTGMIIILSQILKFLMDTSKTGKLMLS